MGLYKDITEKLLQEVDEDIRELMLKEEIAMGLIYKGYELLYNPTLTILEWQALRDGKKNG